MACPACSRFGQPLGGAFIHFVRDFGPELLGAAF